MIELNAQHKATLSPGPPVSSGQECPCDAAQCLANLRGRLGGLSLPGDPDDIAAALPALSSSISQLMTEHQGMADELLSVYEQLGIVFEVTRKLAGVQDEADVLDLFLDSLRRSFAQSSRPGNEGSGRAVYFARRRTRQGETQGWVLEGARRPTGHEPHGETVHEVHDWLRGLLDRAEQRRTVIVETALPAVVPGAVAEAMIAPVISGDVLVCSLVLLRAEGSPAFQASDMMLIQSLTTYCGDLIRCHRLVRELREMSLSMVRALVNAVDQKDEYTCGHSLRVAFYATLLGKRLGLGQLDLQMLQWASLLHDVGKIGIRDEVLKKEGKLTPEEFGHIREHPVRSHKVVQEVPQLRQALDGILHHHERYDGSGYPDRLKGEQIPLQARIIQVADVFDALTSNRSYRKAFEWPRALEILREEAGKTVDPHVEGAFDALIRERMKSDPAAWERIVEEANRFMQGLDDFAARSDGEGT